MPGKHTISLICLVCTVTISGCTALKPFPQAARSGDTIALALGSPEDMTRSNTSATITSTIDGIPVDISSNIRAIFKLYADQESKIYETTSSTGLLVDSSKHSPWVTIAVLDLPQGLPAGAANIEFSTTAVYPDIGSHINDLSLPIEILSGTGSPTDFAYELGIGAQLNGNLQSLEPLSRAVFSPAIPSANCPCPTYGAIEVKATISTTAPTLHPSLLRIVPQDLTVSTVSNRSVLHGLSANGNDLTVTFLSPDGSLQYYEAQFSAVLNSAFQFTGAPTINSIKYYDVSGNETAGPVSDYTAALK